MHHNQQQLQSASSQFRLAGVWIDAIPHGNGHINDTYLVQWQTNGSVVFTILQRINHLIFSNPPQVMDNIVRVTRHLQQRVHARAGRREAMEVILTKNGQSYHQDADGNFWRMYVFIKDALSIDVCVSPAQA